MNHDILVIHNKILDLFNQEEQEVKEKLEVISDLLQHRENFSSEAIEKFYKVQEDLLRSQDYNKFTYLLKVVEIIEKYLVILRIPLKTTMAHKYKVEKEALQAAFNDIITEVISAKKWIYFNLNYQKVQSNLSCYNCGQSNKNLFKVTDQSKRCCLQCNSEEDVLDVTQIAKEVERPRVPTKFAYSRKIHFQECINQYQGKQKCKIPAEVLEKLDAKLKAYGHLVDVPEFRYSKVTKEHIMFYLKQLKLPNHYENANYIYYVLTGNRVDEISDSLEKKIIDDFQQLSCLYDKTFGKDKPFELNRKNYMNASYVLFQLLRNRNHPCKIENFSILKTIEKRRFHDKICSELFRQLGWRFTPTF